MKKREANFQTMFNHYVKSVHKKTGAFELKQTKGSSLPFASVMPHQVSALNQAKNGVMVFKIPDCGYQNPFDGFCLANVPAYVVIKYPDFFCMIDIDDWKNEDKMSIRRSLTATRAKEIAEIIVDCG